MWKCKCTLITSYIHDGILVCGVLKTMVDYLFAIFSLFALSHSLMIRICLLVDNALVKHLCKQIDIGEYNMDI